jgi:phosphoribosylamine--glycine ligase
MKILIIGSGAREHALAKALARSPQTPDIFCCGTTYNPGIQDLCTDYWVGDICDLEEVSATALGWSVELAIIGPEAPLACGLADALEAQGIAVVGPKQALARIEASKAFARDLLKKYNIPGLPGYRVFHEMRGVDAYLAELGLNNYVIKANGLAAGKGVKVGGEHLHTLVEAYQYCDELFKADGHFVIEEKLVGQEFSLLCFSDGKTAVSMPAIQDHKRAFVGNKGPNTGGMGSYTDSDHSLPFLSDQDLEQAIHINELTLQALKTECHLPYIGILYGGFMVTKKGVYVIEFNARFGDPEALNVLAILESVRWKTQISFILLP